jgi:hypothetical protein
MKSAASPGTSPKLKIGIRIWKERQFDVSLIRIERAHSINLAARVVPQPFAVVAGFETAFRSHDTAVFA